MNPELQKVGGWTALGSLAVSVCIYIIDLMIDTHNIILFPLGLMLIGATIYLWNLLTGLVDELKSKGIKAWILSGVIFTLLLVFGFLALITGDHPIIDVSPLIANAANPPAVTKTPPPPPPPPAATITPEPILWMKMIIITQGKTFPAGSLQKEAEQFIRNSGCPSGHFVEIYLNSTLTLSPRCP